MNDKLTSKIKEIELLAKKHNVNEYTILATIWQDGDCQLELKYSGDKYSIVITL